MKLAVWEFMCFALLVSCFGRTVLVDTKTRLDVRLAIWLVGLASLLGIWAPVSGWRPDGMIIILMAAFVLLQLISSQLWSNGVPHQFQKMQCEYQRRRSDAHTRSTDNPSTHFQNTQSEQS